jgi:hypothetical protein
MPRGSSASAEHTEKSIAHRWRLRILLEALRKKSPATMTLARSWRSHMPGVGPMRRRALQHHHMTTIDNRDNDTQSFWFALPSAAAIAFLA